MTARLKLLLIAGLSLVLAAVAGWVPPVSGDVPPDTLPAENWRVARPAAPAPAQVPPARAATGPPSPRPPGGGGRGPRRCGRWARTR